MLLLWVVFCSRIPSTTQSCPDLLWNVHVPWRKSHINRISLGFIVGWHFPWRNPRNTWKVLQIGKIFPLLFNYSRDTLYTAIPYPILSRPTPTCMSHEHPEDSSTTVCYVQSSCLVWLTSISVCVCVCVNTNGHPLSGRPQSCSGGGTVY